MNQTPESSKSSVKFELTIPAQLIIRVVLGIAVFALLIGVLEYLGIIHCYILEGHSVTVALENRGSESIFAHIDNTGRRDDHFPTQTLRLPSGGTTPSGELVPPGEKRSFGRAVGLFDSPTLHIWHVNAGDGAAEDHDFYQCALDTIKAKKLPFVLHIQVVWKDGQCQAPNS